VLGFKQQVSLLERHGCVHHETWEQVRVYAKQEDKEATLCLQLAYFKMGRVISKGNPIHG
jgi:hypothetical protein